jgi:hypothetical protein
MAKVTVEGVGVFNFPDGMSQSEMASAIDAHINQGSTKQKTTDEIGGFLRGAGRIGSTLVELGNTGGTYGKPLGTLLDRVKQRNDGVAGGLQELGANPEAGRFKTTDILAQILGTAGVPGMLAKGAAAVPAISRFAPALESGGFSTGLKGAENIVARPVAGAVGGAASVGLVDPEQAATGAKYGAVAPVAIKAIGETGRAVGRVLSGPAQDADLVKAIDAARKAGYVIPPTQARPSLQNRLLEGFAGKISTAQNASAKNQAVTARVVAEDLGLPADTKITPAVLKSVRQGAGQSYENVRAAGSVTADAQFGQDVAGIASKYKTTVPSFPGLGKTNMHGAPVDEIANLVGALKSKQFDASEAVDAIRLLRENADKAYSAGDKTLGKATKEAAEALESLVGRHLQANGSPQLLAEFQQARQLIAKTYSIEKALNPTTGTIDARNLASQLKRGKPLSGGVKGAAEFAGRFPKASQPIEGMGSLPQTSPLDWALSGGLSAMTSNPLMLAGVAARPAARSMALSGAVQNHLVGGQGLLRLPLEVPSLLSRSAPLLMSDR